MARGGKRAGAGRKAGPAKDQKVATLRQNRPGSPPHIGEESQAENVARCLGKSSEDWDSITPSLRGTDEQTKAFMLPHWPGSSGGHGATRTDGTWQHHWRINRFISKPSKGRGSIAR